MAVKNSSAFFTKTLLFWQSQ